MKARLLQFGNDQPGPVSPAHGQSFLELDAVVALASLDLDVLVDQLQRPPFR